MAGRITRSWKMFSASWVVLREDKRLIVFPVVSALAGIGVIAFFAVPVLVGFVDFQTTHDGWGAEETSLSVQPMGWVIMAIGYVVLMYVGTFMNAALIVAANERLTGTGPGTVSSGFRGASAKAGALVGWVLLASTVGLVLRVLEERFGLIGRIVISLVGIAWSLLTFLVVPVLVLEDSSTGVSVSRSVQLFKTTWGENVIGNLGFGLFGFGVILVAGAIVMVGVMVGSTVALVVMGVIALVWVLVASQVLAALGGIYRVALYRYAVDGQAPMAYAAFDFDGAFRTKRTSGLFSSGRSRTVYRSPSADPGSGPARNPWDEWQPPAEEPIHGEFGIEIPGQEGLIGHRGPPPPPPAPRAPHQATPVDQPLSGWPSSPDWPVD